MPTKKELEEKIVELEERIEGFRDFILYLRGKEDGRNILNCSMCNEKIPWFSTMGQVYEGRFWAMRTNEDTVWFANLCEDCQETVKDLINDNKNDAARGVVEAYRDPMGGGLYDDPRAF